MAKVSLLAGTALALMAGVAGSAFAADLPTRKAPLAPPPPPVFSWNGLYGGVNIGYGFGANSSVQGGQAFYVPSAAYTNPAVALGAFYTPGVTSAGGGPLWSQSTNLNGVTGGGQLGYNYQVTPWLVLGAEADIQAADIRANQRMGSGVAGVAGVTTANQFVDWFGTVRGRVGFTLPSMPNLMVFGTGGFAYGSVESAHRYTRFDGQGTTQSAGSTTSTQTGWTAGGGVEWSPLAFPNWSVKAEYLYTDLGTVNQGGIGFASIANAPLQQGNVFISPSNWVASANAASMRFNTVRVGVNWHFNPLEALNAPSAVSTLVTKGPAPEPVDDYQPFQVRLKMAGVIPTDGSAYITDRGTGNYLTTAGASLIPGLLPSGQTALAATGWSGGPGTPFFGSNTRISSSIVPTVDLSYFITKNWAIEAICCVTPHHVTGAGPLQGASVIKTWVFPPSLLLQYHFRNFGAFQPYLGVGVNYTAFWGTRAGNQTVIAPNLNPNLNAVSNQLAGSPTVLAISGTAASVTPSWGVVGQGGFDYMLNEHWGVNVDVKYIMMEPTAHVYAAVNTAPLNVGPVNVPVNLAVKVNPLVVSGGLTYRFGGSWGLPRLF